MLSLELNYERKLAAVTKPATNAELAAANASGPLMAAVQRAVTAERRAEEWERRWEEERARADMADVERRRALGTPWIGSGNEMKGGRGILMIRWLAPSILDSIINLYTYTISPCTYTLAE